MTGPNVKPGGPDEPRQTLAPGRVIVHDARQRRRREAFASAREFQLVSPTTEHSKGRR